MPVIFSRTFVHGEFAGGADSVDEVLRNEEVSSGTGTGTGTGSSGVFGVLGLNEPSLADLRSIADRFRVPEHVLESALQDGHRAKSERFDDTTLLVLRPATYLDSEERVEFGRVVVIVDHGLLVALAARPTDLGGMLRGLEAIEQSADLIDFGSLALVHGVLAATIDSYGPVEDGLEEDIDQIEEQLFSGHSKVSRRIYELFNELLEFQRANRHLLRMVDDVVWGLGLAASGAGFADANQAAPAPTGRPDAVSSDADGAELPPEMRRRFRRLREQVVHAGELSEGFRAQLDNALNVNATLVAQQQNEDMKRISGWAAILFAPTLVGAIYGMNFQNMPELDWRFGYPFALAAMTVLTVGLYSVFKLKKWF